MKKIEWNKVLGGIFLTVSICGVLIATYRVLLVFPRGFLAVIIMILAFFLIFGKDVSSYLISLNNNK